MSPQTLHPIHTLRSLLILRRISLLAQILALGGLVLGLGVDLPILLITPGILIPLLAEGFAQHQLTHHHPITDAQLLAHLATDFFALSWVFYGTGGASNPFASLLLLPLTLAAITLPVRWLWVITPTAILTYTLLVFFNIPLPPPHGHLEDLDRILSETCSIGGHTLEDAPGSGFALHVAGMWINFALSAFIVYFFLARQAITLREHEQALQAFRERALREERVLAIGLMAAGAAHKLGTPLSTLDVMLGETTPESPPDRADLDLMRQQIKRCKNILADMVASATPQNRAPLATLDWVNGWVDEWHLLRPGVCRPVLVLGEPSPAFPMIAPDRTLDQAIQGLLDNAADANLSNPMPKQAQCKLEIEIYLENNALWIDILDCGPGIPENMEGLLGMHFVTTKTTQETASPPSQPVVGGMGIGFFLTNATIERFGGKVELFRRETCGTRTRVKLPLSALVATPQISP